MNTTMGSSQLRRRWLLAVFRCALGAAGLLAIVAAVGAPAHNLEPDWRGRLFSVRGFFAATSVLAVVSYAVSRLFLSRVSGHILAVAFGGMAGAACARVKFDDPFRLLLLGMAVAVSWLVGLGWLDRPQQERDHAPRDGASAGQTSAGASHGP
jgi:hypothetical protein